MILLLVNWLSSFLKLLKQKSKLSGITVVAVNVLIIISFFYYPPLLLQAQSLPDIKTPVDLVTLNVFPQNPSAHQTVTARVESLSTNIDQATIFWYINNTKVSGGIGQNTFQFQTGNEGSETTVTVKVLSIEGLAAEQTITVRPASVDIAWEARSYTPPFYKGKALFPYQGQVIFSALPNFILHGSAINPKNLVYTWKKDGNVLGSESGYGKNTLTLVASVIANSLNISVTAKSLSNTLIGEGKIFIAAQNPLVLLYKDDSQFGTQYQTALTESYTLQDQELRLKAIPYFFSLSAPHDDSYIHYDWKINNTSVDSNQNNRNNLLLRNTSGVSGSTIVSVDATHDNKLLQSADSHFTINFSK